MKIIRFIVGRLILLINFLTPPKSLQRTELLQSKVDGEAKQLTLYEFEACPFCVKVRRKMKSLNVNIRRVDVKRDPVAREALVQATGRGKVPVLKIESNDGTVQWMPESSDINAYLQTRFSS